MENKLDKLAEIVEYVANVKAAQHRKIGYFDDEDIRQEVRIKCWQLIENDVYDPERSPISIKNYFLLCAENRLIDIKRKLFDNCNSPCKRCPFFDARAKRNKEHDCKAFDDKQDCQMFAKYSEFIDSKRRVNSAQSCDNMEGMIGSNQTNMVEMFDYIVSKIPKVMQEDFQALADSNFDLSKTKIPKKRKTLLKAKMTSILKKSEDL